MASAFDFYCHAAALIVEVDGEIHSSQRDQDEERDKILSAHGFRVMRFANEQIIQSLEETISQILRACQES